MIPQTITQTGVGATKPIAFDIMRNPFNIGIGAIVTGTATYSIQHTFDNIYDSAYNPATGNWFSNDNTAFVNGTSSAAGNYYFPVTASRLVISSGTGSVAVTYIQAGLMGG